MEKTTPTTSRDLIAVAERIFGADGLGAFRGLAAALEKVDSSTRPLVENLHLVINSTESSWGIKAAARGFMAGHKLFNEPIIQVLFDGSLIEMMRKAIGSRARV